MNKKIYAIIIAATLVTIAVNALANILPFNGVTTADVSNQFHIYFVPSGYVFSIWGIIYILLLVFSIGYPFVFKKEPDYLKKLLPLYLISAVLNPLWIILWHYGFYLSTVVVMLGLLYTLIQIYRILLANPPKSIKETVILHFPFWVYLGWISVATIANISAVLWLVNWNGFGIADVTWAAIMMVVAGGLATYITLTTVDFAFALVIVWALIGIMLKFPTQQTMQYAGYLSIVVVAGSWLYRRTRLFLKK